MPWQLGGNIEQVSKAWSNCQQVDWSNCPTAVLDYVWSEVVTDVVDSLKHETLLWKFIGGAVLASLIGYLIHWKFKCSKEIKSQKENLSQADQKLQDLELKLDILTYKSQYGSLPSIQGNLKKVCASFSKPNLGAAWCKYFITDSRRKVNDLPRILDSVGEEENEGVVNASDREQAAEETTESPKAVADS